MFDTAKIQRMTTELGKFSREHDNVYIILEVLNADAVALFRRLKVRLRAILSDVPLYNGNKPVTKIFGLPVLKTEEAAGNFNERTGLILLTKQPVPFIQTTFDFVINGELLTIPAFVLAPTEVLAIYDRLTVMMVLHQYQQDGLSLPMPQLFAERFARGLTTFLDPDTQNVKIQFWDRNYFVAPKYDIDDTAIVLRGQIVRENRYTEKTLEFYRSVYTNAPIVVATWKDELTNEFRKTCQKFSVVLLENTPPAIPGFGSINYQLENAFKGVNYVKENLGVKFVLVTRTDQRLNKFDFLLYFRNMILSFPPHGRKLQGRILFLGAWLTKKYLPFCITDFLAFGYVADIFKFYSMPHLKDSQEFSFRIAHERMFFYIREKLSQANFVKCNLAEHRKKLRKFNRIMTVFVNTDVFWMKDFYRRHFAPLDKTTLLETWWKFTQNYLIFVDPGSVIFDWPKYEDHRRYTTVVKGTDFSQWLDLYRNFKADWI